MSESIAIIDADGTLVKNQDAVLPKLTRFFETAPRANIHHGF